MPDRKSVFGLANLMPRLAACLALIAAVGAIYASTIDFSTLKSLADRYAGDGTAEYFERERYNQLVTGLRLLAVLAAVAGVVLYILRRRISRALGAVGDDAAEVSRAVRAYFLKNPISPQEIGLALVLLAGGVLLVIGNLSLPFRYDEAYTVVNYASKPLFIIVGRYTEPNNHILHTLLVAGMYHLAGLNDVLLRLPAVLAAIVTLPLFYLFVRAEFGRVAAAFAMAYLMPQPLYIEYASNARGYSLLLLAFAAILLCARGLAAMPYNRMLWATFSILIALGFYANPLMIFPTGVAATWLLLVRWDKAGQRGLGKFLSHALGWAGVSLATIAVLYAPTFLASGVDAVLANPNVRSVGHAQFFDALPKLLAGLWGEWNMALPLWAVLLSILGMALGIFASAEGRRHRGLFAAALVIGTSAVLLLKPAFLEARMSLFLLLGVAVLVGAGASTTFTWVLVRSRLTAAHRETSAAALVLILAGALAWAATRPGVAWHFARETGFSPNAAALVSGIKAELKEGDFLVTRLPSSLPIQYYAMQGGVDLKPIRSEIVFGEHLEGSWEVFRLGSEIRTDSTAYLFIDEADRRDVASYLAASDAVQRYFGAPKAIDEFGSGRLYAAGRSGP